MVLALLAVGDDRRARGLEPLDRVANRRVVERVELRIGRAGSGDRLDQPSGLGMLPIGSVGMVMNAVETGETVEQHHTVRIRAAGLQRLS